MSENKRYCMYCQEDHVVSPTFDTQGNPVAYFCNRHKLVCESEFHEWNGANIGHIFSDYIDGNLDEVAFAKMEPTRITALAKRFAYRVLQSEEAKTNGWNFAYMTYWFTKFLAAEHWRLKKSAEKAVR